MAFIRRRLCGLSPTAVVTHGFLCIHMYSLLAASITEPMDMGFKLEPPIDMNPFNKQVAAFAKAFANSKAARLLEALVQDAGQYPGQYPNGEPIPNPQSGQPNAPAEQQGQWNPGYYPPNPQGVGAPGAFSPPGTAPQPGFQPPGDQQGVPYTQNLPGQSQQQGVPGQSQGPPYPLNQPGQGQEMAPQPLGGNVPPTTTVTPLPAVGGALFIPPLEGYSTASPQKDHLTITLAASTLLFSLAIPFAIFGVFGGGQAIITYVWVTIVGYASCSIVMSLLYDMVPDWVTVLASLGIGGAMAFSSYKSPKPDQLAFFVLFLACLLVAILLYDIYAGIPIDYINPAFTGFAGLIYNIGFADSHTSVLRVFYWLIVGAISGVIYLFLPSFVRIAPRDDEEEVVARQWIKYIMCFVCSWPVVAAILQLLYFMGASFNPLGPVSFFYIPCQLQWSAWESYLALVLWAASTFTLAHFRDVYEKENFMPELVSKNVQEQWRRPKAYE